MSKVATRYAKSLIDLANERNELEDLHKDALYFQQVAQNKDFQMLLKSPIISTDKKRKVFDAVFGESTSEMMSKFLNIVLSKGREADLSAIMSAFVTQYKIIKHISDLKITSAVDLSKDAIETIKQKLIAEKGISKDVDIVVEVDPSLVGGMILEFEGQSYDASIAKKLRLLKKDFVGNVYVSRIEKK